MPHAFLGVIPLAIFSLYALAILRIELSVATTIRILACCLSFKLTKEV